MSLDEYDLFPEPDDREPARCRHPRWQRTVSSDGQPMCGSCGHLFDPARQRAGKNNRSRGNKAELDAARAVGGRKVGPLGQPWDVEMPGYARLQVRKYKNPQSLRVIARELARIGYADEQPGYIWIEPGRGGSRLIVFDLREFAARHGVDTALHGESE